MSGSLRATRSAYCASRMALAGTPASSQPDTRRATRRARDQSMMSAGVWGAFSLGRGVAGTFALPPRGYVAHAVSGGDAQQQRRPEAQ